MLEAHRFLEERGLRVRDLYRWDHFYKDEFEIRDNYIQRFGFAVPSKEALHLIGQYAPILEVGSGLGYWVHELRKINVNIKIVATDPYLTEYSFGSFSKTQWTRVEKMTGEEAIQKYNPPGILMIWPDMEDWPYECLKLFSGNVVIYVGEPKRGCTANEDFHDYLGANFRLFRESKIPQFAGIHDHLEVWVRNA